jgi:hypothetical protein
VILRWYYEDGLRRYRVDETLSDLYPITGFDNRSVEASNSARAVLVKTYFFFSVGEKELNLH